MVTKIWYEMDEWDANDKTADVEDGNTDVIVELDDRSKWAQRFSRIRTFRRSKRKTG